MKLKAGHWYYFITASIFVIIAFWTKIRPGSLQSLDPTYRNVIFWVLLAWAGFRALNGYFLFKKSKLNEKD